MKELEVLFAEFNDRDIATNDVLKSHSVFSILAQDRLVYNGRIGCLGGGDR